MPKLNASTRVRSLVASPWFLVVILVGTIILILTSVPRDSPTSAVTLPAASNAQGTGFTYAAHFPGVFGLLALQKLINFQDELFKATMTVGVDWLIELAPTADDRALARPDSLALCSFARCISTRRWRCAPIYTRREISVSRLLTSGVRPSRY